MSNNNIIEHDYFVCKSKRNQKNKHNSFVIWFTGLSGSGKSTIANKVEEYLFDNGIQTYTLDGDNIRMGINKGLGFNEEDRNENLRRIAEIAKLFVDAGMVTIAAFVSPLEKDRELVKDIIGADNFVEVFVHTSLKECENRDVKGLYKKARAGEIKNFTGINAPYEKPTTPDVLIETEKENIEAAIEKVVTFVKHKLEL
ncbi:adenylyl-sulfate kinase [Flavobacterium arcticum]|uniref:Adenylyl-sulfate kinase n=1 Tax=Flavobacterium arcticum TaxID=1784713 RepID=A0A345H9A3_9FLAO|nr:adenylyl-sulfate kinase [Flavobacterium arcticum]AXG73163.1 adenylyl-sulfate kinase [Flavobacterium arcticum]KAF2512955.1 adenylyl-sulfate kinase [Flavobacterium arcticum]